MIQTVILSENSTPSTTAYSIRRTLCVHLLCFEFYFTGFCSKSSEWSNRSISSTDDFCFTYVMPKLLFFITNKNLLLASQHGCTLPRWVMLLVIYNLYLCFNVGKCVWHAGWPRATHSNNTSTSLKWWKPQRLNLPKQQTITNVL